MPFFALCENLFREEIMHNNNNNTASIKSEVVGLRRDAARLRKEIVNLREERDALRERCANIRKERDESRKEAKALHSVVTLLSTMLILAVEEG